MDHLVLRHLSYMRGFTCPFSLSVVSVSFTISCIRAALPWTDLRYENLLYLLNGGVCILHCIVYQSSLTMDWPEGRKPVLSPEWWCLYPPLYRVSEQPYHALTWGPKTCSISWMVVSVSSTVSCIRVALPWTDLRAENLLYFLNGGVCILHCIVQQSSLTMNSIF